MATPGGVGRPGGGAHPGKEPAAGGVAARRLEAERLDVAEEAGGVDGFAGLQRQQGPRQQQPRHQPQAEKREDESRQGSDYNLAAGGGGGAELVEEIPEGHHEAPFPAASVTRRGHSRENPPASAESAASYHSRATARRPLLVFSRGGLPHRPRRWTRTPSQSRSWHR